MAINLIEPRILHEVVGASQVDLPIAIVPISSLSATHFRLDIVCSSVVVAAGITVKLQNRAPQGVFADLGSANASAAIVADGTSTITLLVERAADQVDMPLRKTAQLVITTGVGDSLAIDSISVQQL